MTRFLLLPLCGLLALSGCAHTPAPEKPAGNQAAAPVAPIEYSPETLADLLVAEVAAQRQILDVTLGYYAQAAGDTGDPQVINQAAKLAHFLDDHERALALSQRWLAQVPDNESALQLATLSAIGLGNTDAASDYLDRLLASHGKNALGRLVAQARGLDAKGNQQLVAALSKLSDRYPDQAPLWYARALTKEKAGELAAAQKANQRALSLMPEHLQAQLLQARLLQKQGKTKKALRHLKKLVRKHPESRRPRITYIRLLLANNKQDPARKQLTVMAEQFPDDLDLRFSLALLALEAGATETGEQQLNNLLKRNYRSSDIHLYLAQAAQQRQAPSEAVEHYLKVSGKQSLRARVQAARLLYQQDKTSRAHALMHNLAQQHPQMTASLTATEADMRAKSGDYSGAMALLSDALNDEPDNTDLLYSRAMVAEKIDNLAKLEQDLKRILAINPEDASALNALGYTLADRTQRLEEAHDYVSRALALRPDDPAIMDSMGWVLYRRGQPSEARDYLRRAYEQFPDPEVAAHYGEVLWVLGAQNQARDVWRSTLESHPDADQILQTLDRLGARL